MEPKGTAMRLSRCSVIFLVLIASPYRLFAQTEANHDAATVSRAEAGDVSVSIAESRPEIPPRDLAPVRPESRDLYVKVQIPDSKETRKIKPGQMIDGKLIQGVYSGSEELFPPASRIALTVKGFQRCRKAPSNRWPGVAAIFRPRYKNCPTFESGRVFLAGGQDIPLKLSLLSMGREKHVRAQKRAKTSRVSKTPASQGAIDVQPELAAQGAEGTRVEKRAGLALTFKAAKEIEGGDDGARPGGMPSSSDPSRPPVIAAGTSAKVVLLDSLSASKNHPGELFHARLIEPVRDGTVVILPEGSVLEGAVVKVVRPRTLSRSGSMLLSFNRLILLDGSSAALSASVTGAQLDQSSEANIDPEGGVHGSRPGALWMLINLGTTAGMAKLADDGTQLLVEAIVSTATDASTAGTARIVSTCVSGLFLITRRGRDVVLPQFIEMDVAFNHSFSLTLPQAKLLIDTQGSEEHK